MLYREDYDVATATTGVTDPAVRHHTEGKTVRNVVVAKGKLVNIVVS